MVKRERRSAPALLFVGRVTMILSRYWSLVSEFSTASGGRRWFTYHSRSPDHHCLGCKKLQYDSRFTERWAKEPPVLYVKPEPSYG